MDNLDSGFDFTGVFPANAGNKEYLTRALQNDVITFTNADLPDNIPELSENPFVTRIPFIYYPLSNQVN